MRENHHHHHHHYDSSSRDRYAHHAGESGPGTNMHRMYKDTDRKILAGVCAGIANYYGWRDPNLVRIAWVCAAVPLAPFAIAGYICLAIALKPGPGIPLYKSAEEERFWRTFSTRPKATYSELKHRFRALDSRLADIERTVTSDEYGLKKAFSDLERGM